MSVDQQQMMLNQNFKYVHYGGFFEKASNPLKKYQ
jgi:hypothetical protein